MPQCIMRFLLKYTGEFHNTIKFAEQNVEPIEPTVAHTVNLSFNFPICKMNREKATPWSFARGEAGSWVLVLSAFSLSHIWVFYNATSPFALFSLDPLSTIFLIEDGYSLNRPTEGSKPHNWWKGGDSKEWDSIFISPLNLWHKDGIM